MRAVGEENRREPSTAALGRLAFRNKGLLAVSAVRVRRAGEGRQSGEVS